MSITVIRDVTFEDKGLKTLVVPNDTTHVSEVFPNNSNIHSTEVENDSICTGRLRKYPSGASVPATLTDSDIAMIRMHIPTNMPIGSHLRHAYHFPCVPLCRARKKG